MKLKKFEAPTEAQAVEMIRGELGDDAVVLNVKKVKPHGISSIFKKPYVEVTAAYEDRPLVKISGEELKEKILKTGNKNISSSNENSKNEEKFKAKIEETLKNAENEIKIKKKDEEINKLEKKLADTENLLNKTLAKLTSSKAQAAASAQIQDGKRKYDNELLQFFYDSLVEQEIMPKIAEELLEDIENVEDINSINLNLMVKIVYNKIVNMLGKPSEIIESSDKFAKNIVFIGPTGVGKTTTMAKISSDLIINHSKTVGFISADTYRIAAVEQLKTYAEILDSEVAVVYNPDDMKKEIENLRAIYNYIFIDTAGRSHKNKENIQELKQLLDAVESPNVYLVLSITTKCEDLLNIIDAYSQFTDFKLILTKLDETLHLGSILNLCHETGREVSYISSGQNVPDDFELVRPEKIAKALLGSINNGSSE